MFLIRDRGFRPISLAIARASPESRHRFFASLHCASLVVCPILTVLLDAIWPQRTILTLPGPREVWRFFVRSEQKVTKPLQPSPQGRRRPREPRIPPGTGPRGSSGYGSPVPRMHSPGSRGRRARPEGPQRAAPPVWAASAAGGRRP